MSLRSNLRLQKGLLQMTTSLVVFLGIVLILNLLSFRPAASNAASREPAAMGTIHWEDSRSVTAASAVNMSRKSLNCLRDGHSYKLQSQGKRLQLKGTLCGSKEKILSSLIVNKTNGYEATVFSLRPSEFTTDYIDLTSGENLIHASHELADGKRVISQFIVHH